MTHTVLVDVAIGLVLMYFLLSTFAMAINELLAKLFDTRAKDLEQTLSKLLDGSTQSEAKSPQSNTTTLVERLYHNPIVAGLASARLRSDSRVKSVRVSYMRSDSFAEALLDTLGEGVQTVEAIENGIRDLPEGKGKEILKRGLAEAGQDIQRFRERTAALFDDAMERLSGAYKRKQQLWAFLVGAVLALLVNADTTMMIHRLQAEPALRQASVSAAQQKVAQDNCKGTTDVISCLERELVRSDMLGWDLASYGTDRGLPPEDTSIGGWLYWLLLKSLGIFFTAIAVSFGAPFWFDLLGKLPGVTIRSTGTPPKDGQRR
jgi:hypothetical protein